MTETLPQPPPGGDQTPPDTRPRHPSARFGAVALAVLALIWGYNWVVTKVAIQDAEPFTFAVLRTLPGAVALLALLPVLRRPSWGGSPGLVIALGLTQTTAFVGLSVLALETGGAGKVAVLVYTMPFWLLLLAWAMLGERVRGLQWAAVGLALLGLVLVLEPWALEGVLSSVLAVLAGLSWAVSAVLVKLLDRRQPVDPLTLTAWQMLIGVLPLIGMAAARWTGPPDWTASLVAAVLFNIVLANVVGWVLWLLVLRSLPAGAAGLGTLAIPVVGVAAAWLQLGERPDPVEAVGMAAIVAALALLAALGARKA